jgi:serine/threonine-protein kinase
VDALTGQPRWVRDFSGGDPKTSSFGPTVANGVVYVGTKRFTIAARGTFVALDAATGRVLWTYSFQPEFAGQYSGCFGSAVVYGSVVIVPQEDGRIFALDQATGVVRWIAPRVHTLPGPDGFGGTYNDLRYLALRRATVVATSTTGTMVAIDAATGRELWRTSAYPASVVMPPSVDDSTAYVAHGGLFAVYDLGTGRLRWALPDHEETPNEYSGTAIPDGDRIYVTGYHGFYALRK